MMRRPVSSKLRTTTSHTMTYRPVSSMLRTTSHTVTYRPVSSMLRTTSQNDDVSSCQQHAEDNNITHGDVSSCQQHAEVNNITKL